MLCALVLVACGCSQNANQLGVGAQCTANAACETGQVCLTEFSGGYCGIAGCQHDIDCPQGSACVTGSNGVNYCFLVCANKTDCNAHRSANNEADCNSALTFVEGTMSRKVCRPPSSGTSTDGGTPG
jgi:hypothetical protein